MNGHWQGLTGRERGLVIVAGALIAAFALYLALVRPLDGYSARAQRDLASSSRLYETIARYAAEAKSLGAAVPHKAEPAVPVRVAVSAAARDAGVIVSRIQPGDGGSLSVWLESVPSQPLFTFLADLSEKHGLAPAKVFIQKNTGGSLRVQLQFAGNS